MGITRGPIAANVLHGLGPGRESPAAQICSRQSRVRAGRAGRVDRTAAAGRRAPDRAVAGDMVLTALHAKSLQSCPALCDPVDFRPPDSSVHGVLQARILEWIALAFSRGSSQARDQTHIACVSPASAGRFLTTEPSGKTLLYLTRYLPKSLLSHCAGH